MDIDDFLRQKKFKKLDSFLTKEMYKTAGDDLVQKMIDVWVTEKEARNWFYTINVYLYHKRPYDMCKDGKSSDVENWLLAIEYGILL